MGGSTRSERLLSDVGQPARLEADLRRRGWIGAAERVVSVESETARTRRVKTSHRSFVLKQASIEGAFYREIQSDAALAEHMPRMLGFDPDARLLMLEDLNPAKSLASIYTGEPAGEADLGVLVHFLLELHCNFSDGRLSGEFANREMRARHHDEMFVLPWGKDDEAAGALRSDAGYRERVRELGNTYLSDGFCLAHGDYRPPNWVKTADGMRVINPVFSFFGAPEFDVGLMTAHLYLARAPQALIDDVLKIYTAKAPLDLTLTRGFAGIEIAHRLICAVRLPPSYSPDEKRRLLEISRTLVTRP